MNDNAKAWVEALRSGKYQRAQGQLYDGNGYCCLGVACELYGEAHGIDFVEAEPGDYRFMGDGGYLPEPVRDWLGLRDSRGRYLVRGYHSQSLAGNNDSGHSFELIANTIESEPEDLFA